MDPTRRLRHTLTALGSPAALAAPAPVAGEEVRHPSRQQIQTAGGPLDLALFAPSLDPGNPGWRWLCAPLLCCRASPDPLKWLRKPSPQGGLVLRNLEKTPLRTSDLMLGCAFNTVNDAGTGLMGAAEADAIAAVKVAVEAGIHDLDVSASYGAGLSEECTATSKRVGLF